MSEDRIPINRDDLFRLVALYQLRFSTNRNSESAIRLLDERGVKWWRDIRADLKCQECGSLIPHNTTGRPIKFCSRKCNSLHIRKKNAKPISRTCATCGNKYIVPYGPGHANSNCCSDQCRETYHQNAYQKRLDDCKDQRKKKAKICKRCGSIFNRLHSMFCSDQCSVAHRIESRKTWRNEYSQRDEVKQRRKNKNNSVEAKAKRAPRARLRNKQRRKEDSMYAMKERVRSLTKAAFRGNGFTKGCKTREMIGCSWETFKAHIESQFSKGMNWRNRNLWHLDHIIPLASAETEADLIKLSHFSNLRPLWAEENISKGDKIITCQPELAITL